MFKKKMFDRELANELQQIPIGIKEKPGIRQAMAEIFQILNHSAQEVRSRIPEKFMQMLEKYMDLSWESALDFSKSLNDMEMLDETRDLIYLINRDFLCSESQRREMTSKPLQIKVFGQTYQFVTLYELIDMMD